MFAPQNQEPDIIDAWSGTLQDWYDSIDNALTVSEIIPGNYEYSTATSYGNVGDINEGDSTFVDVFCDRFKIISLDNSFISLEQEVKITVAPCENLEFTEFYIGYKCSADIIDHYRFYSNTDKIQDVHNARYEWFMLYNSLSDEVKNGSDCFATIDKIRNHNPMVPGVYVDLSKITAETEILVKIPLRIPIAFFLMLFNLRYYPNWAGKLSIEIFPTYQNLVVAPVVSHEAFVEYKEHIETTSYDLGFRNIGEYPSNNIKKTVEKITTGDGADKKEEEKVVYKAATQQFVGMIQVTKNIKIKLAQYMLRMEVFNALSLKYLNVGMLFPIHQVQIRDFTQELPLASKSDVPVRYNTAATIGLTHCDTMFIVFRRSQHSRTCFVNPQITYRVNIGGKFYPNETYQTFDDQRHVNLLLDSLNVNNSLLTSISKDILTSTQPFYHRIVYDAEGKGTDKKCWNGGDNSNFFIGIPFADSEDFMGGLSTTGTVQIELSGDRQVDTAIRGAKYIAPVGIYYEDVLLKIRSQKPMGRSQIEVTTASIEQILSGVKYEKIRRSPQSLPFNS